MFGRFVERRAEEALSDTPVVLIVGPRRAGKTTLVRKMGEAGRTYITLDDQTVLEAAQSDPAGFIRGLDRAMFLKLASCDWIRAHHDLLVTGPTGLGKSWLVCALGQKACRDDISVSYRRMPRLLADLALARGTGRHARNLLRPLTRVDLLILDDWGPESLTAEQRRDFMEIIEERHNCRSTIITSQLPVDRWYDLIGDPTLADAILDRLVHNAYRIELAGESLRKKRPQDGAVTAPA